MRCWYWTSSSHSIKEMSSLEEIDFFIFSTEFFFFYTTMQTSVVFWRVVSPLEMRWKRNIVAVDVVKIVVRRKVGVPCKIMHRSTISTFISCACETITPHIAISILTSVGSWRTKCIRRSCLIFLNVPSSRKIYLIVIYSSIICCLSSFSSWCFFIQDACL